MFHFLGKLINREPKALIHAVGAENAELSSAAVTVVYNEQSIQVESGGTTQGELEWQDIDSVYIRIENKPSTLPVWYVGYQDNFLRIPNDAIGAKNLFFKGMPKYLQHFASDSIYQKIAHASSAINGLFLIWTPNIRLKRLIKLLCLAGIVVGLGVLLLHWVVDSMFERLFKSVFRWVE